MKLGSSFWVYLSALNLNKKTDFFSNELTVCVSYVDNVYIKIKLLLIFTGIECVPNMHNCRLQVLEPL